MVGPEFEMLPMITNRVEVRAGRSDTLPHGLGEIAGRPETALELAAGRWKPEALSPPRRSVGGTAEA